MKLAITLLSLAWLCLASSPSHAQKVERITMVGGPPSGVFGIFATGIGTYLSKNVPGLDVSVTATGGSVENTRRVNGGDAEMGLSFASDVHEAYHGLEQFKDKPLTNIRAIGLVVFGVAHLITFADSGNPAGPSEPQHHRAGADQHQQHQAEDDQHPKPFQDRLGTVDPQGIGLA